MSKRVAVVVQTHWDREWYYPHQTFLARLLLVIQQVVEQLDSGQLHSFLFDGQVSAIDDFYQHAEPELAERVRAHVAAGRIVIGPWYIMADEFLCAGESLVRNLELGIKRAEQYGRAQRVGYLPDTFGHISQMPQLLRGFGIDNAVAWRGIDAQQSEVLWQSPDGSRVFTVFLSEGYYQHPFNTADWHKALNTYLEKIVNRGTGGELLLTQGGDHLLTVENLQQKIDGFNCDQRDYQLVQRSLEDYIADLQATGPNEAQDTQQLQGELRGNRSAFVLPDVLSTRQYLKAQNQLLEDRLLGLIEPLLAVSPPQQFPMHYLERTWQLLIEQHAHDSICGCSVDEVHREMEVRFTQLHQRLDALQQQALHASGMRNRRLTFHRTEGAPSPFADDSKVSLFNPSPKARTGWQVFDVFLRGGLYRQLELESTFGELLPLIVLAAERGEEFHSPLDDFPDLVHGHRYTVAVCAALDGLQMLSATVRGVDQCKAGLDEPNDQQDMPDREAIENSHYRIAVTGDNLIVEDKISGHRFANALRIVSESDGGDTYNFSPVDDQIYCASIVAASAHRFAQADNAAHIEELLIDFNLRQPAGLTVERVVADEQVTSRGQLRLRLVPDDGLIDARLDWDNQARDQRLRLLLPLGEVVTHTAGDSAFDWVRRDKVYAQRAEVHGQQEAPVSVFPSQSAVGGGMLGFLHRGLSEGEVVAGESEDYLAVTLIRSVGWLSRRDLKTRGLGAGPDLATPDAQCLRAQHFEFAFTFHRPAAVELLNRADAWRRPLTLLRGHAARPIPGVQLLTSELQVSSLRRVERGGTALVEIRVWNPSDAEVRAEFDREVQARTDLAGNLLEKDQVVAPRQIATFSFVLGGNAHA